MSHTPYADIIGCFGQENDIDTVRFTEPMIKMAVGDFIMLKRPQYIRYAPNWDEVVSTKVGLIIDIFPHYDADDASALDRPTSFVQVNWWVPVSSTSIVIPNLPNRATFPSELIQTSMTSYIPSLTDVDVAFVFSTEMIMFGQFWMCVGMANAFVARYAVVQNGTAPPTATLLQTEYLDRHTHYLPSKSNIFGYEYNATSFLWNVLMRVRYAIQMVNGHNNLNSKLRGSHKDSHVLL